MVVLGGSAPAAVIRRYIHIRLYTSEIREIVSAIQAGFRRNDAAQVLR